MDSTVHVVLTVVRVLSEVVTSEFMTSLVDSPVPVVLPVVPVPSEVVPSEVVPSLVDSSVPVVVSFVLCWCSAHFLQESQLEPYRKPLKYPPSWTPR